MPLTTIKSSNIKDSEIKNVDISPTADIAESKVSGLDAAQISANAFNIGVLGFKMAVSDGLTIFNLVDGIVDEFHDEGCLWIHRPPGPSRGCLETPEDLPGDPPRGFPLRPQF